MECSLCLQNALTPFRTVNNHDFLKCNNCDVVLLDKRHFLSSEAEKARYLLHNNDIEDIGYQQFVSPITNGVLTDFPSNTKGLDFGSGTGPVIADVLRKNDYDITTYDPFFDNQPSVLEQQYDFIVCCEVMEHFYSPNKEFKLLKSLLKPNGKLYCMTKVLHDRLDFNNWYYKNDPTHVIFYTPKSLQWIANHFGFKKVLIENKHAFFEI